MATVRPMPAGFRGPRLVRTENLKLGPIRHEQLPDALIQRIKVIHDALREVLSVSLEERIDDFRRDLYPEREVEVWELIVAAYKDITSQHGVRLSEKRQILSALVALTMGMEPAVIVEQKADLDSATVEAAIAALRRCAASS